MSDIYTSLHGTKYGNILESSPRFGRFIPEFVTTEQWYELLGDDVNNYRHMKFTAELAQWYIDEAEAMGGGFSELQQQELLTTAYTHDFAEAIDGDIPDPDKDHSYRSKVGEALSFYEVASTILEPEEARALALDVLPIMHDQHPLGRDFRAIEIIGYWHTGKLAGEQAHLVNVFGDRFDYSARQVEVLGAELTRLSLEVVQSCLNNLDRNFSDLVPVSSFLEDPRYVVHSLENWLARK